MAFPGNWTLVEVRGKYIDAQGNPVAGSVTFTARAPRVVDLAVHTTVIAAPIVCTLDGFGAFAVDIPAGDDPDVSPTGFSYIVTEKFVGSNPFTYDINVPRSAVTAGLELSVLAPVIPSGGNMSGAGEVTRLEFDAFVAQKGANSGLAPLDSTGKVPTANLPSSTVSDPNAVKLTGAQTVAGVKTFSSSPVIPDNSLTIAKTSGLQAAIDAAGTSGSAVLLTGAQTVAGVKTFSSAPVVPANAFQIASTAGLQAELDSKLTTAAAGTVNLSGAQTINGVKTFSNSPVVPDSSWSIAKTTGLQAALDSAGSGGGGAVDSVNGHTGIVVLNTTDVGAAAAVHTHTTTQITALAEFIQDTMNSTLLVAGTGITKAYDDTANTLTLTGSGGSGGVTSVEGRTGDVVLTKGDVNLAFVDNTADIDKPISTEVQLQLDLRADLINNLVPLVQIPKSQNPTGSTIGQRRVGGTFAVATGVASDDAVNLAQLTAATATTVTDVRTLRTSTVHTASDAITWVPIPGFDVIGVKTGDLWRVSFVLVTSSSQTGGIEVRFQNTGNYLTAADWMVSGAFKGITTSGSATNLMDSKQQVIQYPTGRTGGGSNTISGSFGGIGVASSDRSVVQGEFEVSLPGAGKTAQVIGFEFRQRSLDAAVPTTVLPGSYMTAVNAL